MSLPPLLYDPCRDEYRPSEFQQLSPNASLASICCSFRKDKPQGRLGWARLDGYHTITSGCIAIEGDLTSVAQELNSHVADCFIDRAPRLGETSEEALYRLARVKPSWYRLNGPPFSLLDAFTVRPLDGCGFSPFVRVEKGLEPELHARRVSIGVQKGPPIGAQKEPLLSSSMTGLTDAPFALVAA